VEIWLLQATPALAVMSSNRQFPRLRYSRLPRYPGAVVHDRVRQPERLSQEVRELYAGLLTGYAREAGLPARRDPQRHDAGLCSDRHDATERQEKYGADVTSNWPRGEV
jgi:hypothetical protein